MKNKNILEYQKCIGCTIEVLVEELRQILDIAIKNLVIQFRVKNPEILRKKMRLKNVHNIFLIDDVYGIRIIVESVKEAYQVLIAISQMFPGHIDHDYFKEPKAVPSVNGKILRLLQFIAYRNGIPFEIQITTVACDKINESLHQGYYERKYHS